MVTYRKPKPLETQDEKPLEETDMLLLLVPTF